MISSFLASRSEQASKRVVDMFSYMVLADVEQCFADKEKEGLSLNQPINEFIILELEKALDKHKSIMVRVFTEELKKSMLDFEINIFGCLYNFFIHKSKKLLTGF